MEQVFTGSQVNLQLSQHKVDQNWGGIPALLPDGTQVLIYCGIIDILQCYKLLKKTEHFFKSLYTNGEEISGTKSTENLPRKSFISCAPWFLR
jgi:hypothetical protein